MIDISVLICRNDPPGMARLGEIGIENIMCEIMLVWLGLKRVVNVDVLGDRAAASGLHLNASVGRSGANAHRDVVLAQFMLNEALYKTGVTLLKLDGIAGPKTCGAIETFQRRLGMHCDGRIDRGGRTFSAMAGIIRGAIVPGLQELPLYDQLRSTHPTGEYEDPG